MRVRNTHRGAGEGIELRMTAMIDIVFLLLIFFILTFRVVDPEGDLNIKMPRAGPPRGEPEPDGLPPIQVRLTADGRGELAEIRFGDAALGRDFRALRQCMLEMVGPQPNLATGDAAEVELDCDYHLRYENVIEAITAVSGYVIRDGPDRGEVVPLAGKIRFGPRRRGSG